MLKNEICGDTMWFIGMEYSYWSTEAFQLNFLRRVTSLFSKSYESLTTNFTLNLQYIL